jgi:arsenite/tail-anchored protein-transporting ATPase
VRTLLVTGLGGAGTTTTAAAAAVRVARAGRRTVLISRQRPPVEGLAEVPGLSAVVVDAQAGVERFWSAHSAALGSVVPLLRLPPASSVVPVPGAADLALLAALGQADADLVVLDAGPVDAAVALLGLPGALHWWLGQLLPARLRALAAMGAATGSELGAAASAALTTVPALERLLARGPLADPGAVDVVLTAVPRRGAADTLRTATTALALHGLRPAAVLARVLPAGSGVWWARRGAEQDAELADLADVAPLSRVDEAATLPRAADDLAALLGGAPLPGVDADPSPAPARPAPQRTGPGWELTVPLPFADRGAVELTRFGDDLVLSVSGARRSLRLDPLLRRCTVTGGRLAAPGSAEARLVVSFEPDPQQWPADLLAAHGAPG